MAAAEQLLLETGDQSALSIRAIANSVGVTPPSIYLHFADRNELLYAVCDRHWDKLHEHMDRAAQGVEDPWARVAARGRAYIDFALANPEHYRVIMMARHDTIPEWAVSELPPGYEHLLDDVREAMAAGQIRGDDPLLVASGLWMMVHGIASLLITKPEISWPPRDELIEHVLHTYGAGLGQGPAPVRSRRRPPRR